MDPNKCLKTKGNLKNDHPKEIPRNPGKHQKRPTGIPPVGSKARLVDLSAFIRVNLRLKILDM
jgi:hypothetical protein